MLTSDPSLDTRPQSAWRLSSPSTHGSRHDVRSSQSGQNTPVLVSIRIEMAAHVPPLPSCVRTPGPWGSSTGAVTKAHNDYAPGLSMVDGSQDGTCGFCVKEKIYASAFSLVHRCSRALSSRYRGCCHWLSTAD